MRLLPSPVLWINRIIFMLYGIMAVVLLLTICYLFLQPADGFLGWFGKAAMEQRILKGNGIASDIGHMTGHLFFPFLFLVSMQAALMRRRKIPFYIALALFFVFSISHIFSFVFSTVIFLLSLQPAAKDYLNLVEPVKEFDSI